MANEDTPTVTSLVVGDAQPHPYRPTPMPPWQAPFLRLLGSLKIIDTSKLTPKVVEQRFCFQPSHDLSEISRIFLSVSTSDHRYDIDLKSIRVMGSDATPSAVIELQEYANKVLRRNQEFRDRLLQHDIICDPTRFILVDMFTCPACLYPLIGCLECDAKVACSNQACLAALVVDCEQCPEHRRVVCNDCLRQSQTIAPLVCCPTCQKWCCRDDVDWCAGLAIYPALGSKELVELSRGFQWGSETIPRSHPPKPGPCRVCTDRELVPGWTICRNNTDDIMLDRCPSQMSFMTIYGLHAAYCPDCIESSQGHHCACGLSWLCNTCFAVENKTLEYPIFVTCPRCRVNYCTGPLSCTSCIDFCRGCKGVILCINCQEEEELPGRVQTGHELPKEVVFTEQCTFCQAWSCGECCISMGTARCAHCRGWFCRGCISELGTEVIQPCPSCGEPLCTDCKADEQDCNRAMMLCQWTVMPPHPDDL